MFYFAYGSNLCRKQMRARCPDATVVTRAELLDHAIAFGGYSWRWDGGVASAIAAPGASVPGLLYRISPWSLLVLDRYEGHPHAYRRETVVVRDIRGRHRRAAVYFQPEDRFEPMTPACQYLRVLQRAYARLGFDLGALRLAARGAQ